MFSSEFKLIKTFQSPHNDSSFGSASFSNRPLTSRFFNRPASEVARDLLGKKLISTLGGRETSGYIVETQAYTGAGDSESHIYRGKSSERVNWKPGSLYIYSIQGQVMLTFTTPSYEEGACVLIRALQPIDGLKTMERRRGPGTAHKLTKGPGNLSKALGITVDLNGTNIFDGNEITVLSGYPLDGFQVVSRARLNCNKNPAPLLRFYIDENGWVTSPR